MAGAGWVLWQQNETYQHRWDEYRAAQADATDEADFLRRIRGLLPTAHQEVKVRILQKMAQYRDVESVPAITDQLGSEVVIVRTAAARALARIASTSRSSINTEWRRSCRAAT